MLRSLRKKWNSKSRKSYIPTQKHLPTKVNADIDLKDEPVVWYDVPVVENSFVDDRK